jgi:hypothetical protein
LALLRLTGVLAATVSFMALTFSGAFAQVTNWQALSDKIITPKVLVQASPSPSPAAPAEHKYRIRVSGETNLSVIDQNYVGSGLGQQEDSSFISGLPFAPGMGYDFFSTAPTASGFGLGENLKATISYGPGAVDYGVTLGFGSASGSAQTVGYWGLQPIPTINPALGQTSYRLPVAFPTKPGLDDVSGVRGSVLGGYVATKDGNYSLNVGWLDLKQTMKFVFQQAPVTNSSPAIAVVVPGSIGNGAPSLEDWLPANTQLPLSGADAFAKLGDVSFEGTDATMPAPMGVGARVENASILWAQPSGTRWAVQFANIHTGGTGIASTTFFGTPITAGATGPCLAPTTLTAAMYTAPSGTSIPGILANPATNFGQGSIPFTCVNGQQNQIIGVSGSGTLFTILDGVAEAGYSTYSTAIGASGVGVGTWLHGGLTQHLGSLSFTEDYYNVDPRYAPTVLPYGNCCTTPAVAENIWSAPYIWPASWLRGDYQSIDNSQAYNNRRGFKFGADYEGDLFQFRVKYSVLSEIYPDTLTTASQAGFVDGYYQPELTTVGGNLGIDRQLAAWLAVHPKIMDVTFDYVSQNNYRPMFISTQDIVAMNYPQASLTLSKNFNDKLLVAGGVSNFLVKGTWAGGPINMNQNVLFVGAQFLKSQSQQFSVQARYYNTNGTAPLTDTIAPTLRGLQLLFLQQAKF